MKLEYVWTEEESLEYRAEVEAKRKRLVECQSKNGPINRFQERRRFLTNDQSTLVSNLVHHFDRLHDEETQALNSLRKSLPLKLRLKISNYEDLLRTYYKTNQSFLESLPLYQNLDVNHRSILSSQYLTVLTCVGTSMSMSLTDFRPHSDKDFGEFHEIYYGKELCHQYEKYRLRVDSILRFDPTLMKLFLAVLAFTPLNCEFFQPIICDSSYIRAITERQHRLLELLWHYMIARFEPERLVIQIFSKMVMYCLELQNFMHRLSEQTAQSTVDIDELIKKTQSELFIDRHDQ